VNCANLIGKRLDEELDVSLSKKQHTPATTWVQSILLGLVVISVCVPASGEDLTGYTGPGLYKEYCASCHGISGLGDGPVASSLKVEVPNLTRIAARQGGRFPADRIRKIIDGRTTMPPHGSREMPVWGQEFRSAAVNDLPAQQRVDGLIDLLVQYIQSIQGPPR
jgi:mono/diheme cytochrome c family protein